MDWSLHTLHISDSFRPVEQANNDRRVQGNFNAMLIAAFILFLTFLSDFSLPYVRRVLVASSTFVKKRKRNMTALTSANTYPFCTKFSTSKTVRFLRSFKHTYASQMARGTVAYWVDHKCCVSSKRLGWKGPAVLGSIACKRTRICLLVYYGQTRSHISCAEGHRNQDSTRNTVKGE